VSELLIGLDWISERGMRKEFLFAVDVDGIGEWKEG
jgi:hypothetical protein